MSSSHVRFRYGVAIGRENNFYTGIPGQKGYLAGTDGLFAQGNTAPDVTLGNLFYSNNTVGTIIRDFTLSHPTQNAGNLAGLFEGKIINVIFLDDSTSLARSARLQIVGTDGLQTAGSISSFIYHNSAWYQFGAERTQNNFLVVDSTNFAQGALAANSAINVRGISTVVLNGSGGLNIVPLTLFGGEEGQEVMLYAVSAALITVNTAGLSNSFIVSSTGGTQYRLGSTGTISFRHVQGYWVQSN